MKLKRVTNLLSKWLRSTVIMAVVGAMLVSMIPALSSPAAAWSLPNPRWIEEDERWNYEMVDSPGSHVMQTAYQVRAVRNTRGTDDWISRAVYSHWHDLIRGNLWADDYSYWWAKTDLEQRVVTWRQFFKAAGCENIPPKSWGEFAQAAFGDTPFFVIEWVLNELVPPGGLDLDAPAYLPELSDMLEDLFSSVRWRLLWLQADVYGLGLSRSAAESLLRMYAPLVGDKHLGIKHPDYSLYHLYESEEWFDDLLLDGVDEQFRDEHGWDVGNNASSRAEFWYQQALDKYEEHGRGRFPDLFYERGIRDPTYEAYDYTSDGRRLVTAYDYLGRALHYVQDMTQPAHSEGTYRHMFDLWYYEHWSSQRGPAGDWGTWKAWPNWPEDATGADFAKRAHSFIAGSMYAWGQLGGGVFLGTKYAPWRFQDRHLEESAPSFLQNSVWVGAGMLIRFHQEIEQFIEPEPDYYLTIAAPDGDGFTVPSEGVHGYQEDDEITVTAIPHFAWKFVKWIGAVESSDETITLIMDGDKEIRAVFEPIPLKFGIGDVVGTTAPLNVRDEPGLGTNIIRTQPAQTAGIILSAPDPYPRFLDSYTWWLIEYDDGTVGWSSDHRLEEYIRPAPRFSVGDYVVTTDELYVRSEPRLTDESGIYFTDNVDATQPGGSKGKILDFEEPMPRQVMGYSMWKVEYEDGTVGWSSDHRLMEDGTFVPIDLVLVLDRSGSMSSAMMRAAKDAGIAVINTLMPYDRVAVVSFASTARTDVQLTSDFDHAKTEIQKIAASGGTSFGAGLRLAVEELKTRGSEDHAPVIIFMSDGYHNTSPAPDYWVEECKNLGIPIYTIGFGSSPSRVDEARLTWMAEETGGRYLFAPGSYELQSIFLRFSLQSTGWPFTTEFSGVVAEGEIVEAGTFDVEAGTEHVRLTLNWPGSDLDLIVIRPDGSEVDLGIGSDNVYSGRESKPEWVILLDPPPGTWTVEVYGRVTNSDIPFTVWVSTYVAPTGPMIPSTYKFEYSIPDPIVVASDVDIDVAFMTDEEKDIGYDGVRFRFETEGPGDVTFTATDSEGAEHTFLNNGFWGPWAGFDLPALYEATTTWTLNFLHRAGDYTITFSLIEAPDGDVIAEITETVSVTVKPLPAVVSIDPDTLNLRARGQWITAYIELPENYAAEDIEVGTVQLLHDGNELQADWGDVQDGVLMVKFDWATVAGWFEGLHDVEVELTIPGEVAGADFEGIDTIRIIDPPRPGRGAAQAYYAIPL